MAKELDIQEEFRKLKLEIAELKKKADGSDELEARIQLLEDPPLAVDQANGGFSVNGVFPDHTPPSMGLMMPLELELGKPKTTPSSAAGTITLRPCNFAGSEITGEADVVVRCAVDGSDIDFAARGWTTSTVLTFLRCPEPYGSIEGVLLGEGDTKPSITKQPMQFEKWYDITGNTGAWDTADDRDWSSRFVSVVVLHDGSTPVDNGSWDEGYASHEESFFRSWIAQEQYQYFRLFLRGDGAAQNITKVDTGSTDFYIQMAADGTLEVKVENYTSVRTQIRLWIRASKQLAAADAEDLS